MAPGHRTACLKQLQPVSAATEGSHGNGADLDPCPSMPLTDDHKFCATFGLPQQIDMV
jgi:hypothetical protein